jgi:PAS domain S-box-containing protein
LDLIYVLDAQGCLTYANRAAANYLGIEPEKLVGRSLRELFPPEMAQRRLEQIRRVFATGQVFEEDELFTLGTSEVWLNVRLMPVRDEEGQVTSIMGVCRDITQRKEAERWLADKRDELEREIQRRTEDLISVNAALRASRDELQTIYDGMVDGVVILDVETREAYRVNPALCRMLGYTAEELIALPDEQVYPPGEATYWMARLDEHAAGRVSRNESVPLVRKDGTTLLADITTSCIEYKGRRCLIAFLRDVTERHRAEEALRREKRSLARLLRAVDHDRQIIAYEIHDGLAQLIAGALMQFQAFAGARERNPEKAEQAFQTAMQILRDSHREVRTLISGVRPPILDEFGLLAAIGNLVDGFAARGGPAIEYRTEVDFERLAKVEENSIYRIVQEALSNAWQHSGSSRISVQLKQRGDDLHVTVQDWGSGFQQEHVRDDHFGLHGIGERARMLGGRAEVESRPGQGTRITVQVPVIESEEMED